MKRSKTEVTEVTEATERLRTILESVLMRTTQDHKPAVYRIIRHQTKAGSTEISFYVADKRGDLLCLDYLISCVTGARIGKHRGVCMPFVNMDPAVCLFDSAMHATFPKSHPMRDWQPRLRLEQL